MTVCLGVCTCEGPSGTAEAATRCPVLPAAHAAAADQQCPAPQPGCSSTGTCGYDCETPINKHGQQKLHIHPLHISLQTRLHSQPAASPVPRATACPSHLRP